MNEESRDDNIDSLIDDRLNYKIPFPRLSYINADRERWPKIYKYNIALISLNLGLKADFEKVSKNRFNLIKIKEDKSKYIKIQILKLIIKAINEFDANIIVFPEFSYPILEHDSLRRSLKKICCKNNIIIIAGSYHETRDETHPDFGSNICPIYAFGDERNQFKNHAGSIGGDSEIINTLAPQKLNVFQTRYGTFSVPICIDIYDQNLVGLLTKMNQKDKWYHPIDFLIVPAFTDDDNGMIRACQRCSKNANISIIYLNNFSNEKSPGIFISGVLDESWTASGLIHAYQIDLIKIRKQRLSGNKYTITKPKKLNG